MKRRKAQVEKESVGTGVGAKYRARCNHLTDAEREKLNDEFMKLDNCANFIGLISPRPLNRVISGLRQPS